MSKTFEFSISAGRLAVVGACLALSGVLIGAAGFATGVLLAPRFAAPAPALEASIKAPEIPKIPIVAPPALAKPAIEPAPVAVPTAVVPPVAATPKTQTAPIQLSVRVGSFVNEENAQRTVERLKHSGYPAVAYPFTDSRSHLWHVVQVGPYLAYDRASQTVLELTTRYRLTPVIVPSKAF